MDGKGLSNSKSCAVFCTKNRLKSKQIYEAACLVSPGGVNSPVRAFKGLNIHPMVVSSGEGAILTDVDGHCYIDYCCSWGASILGHAPPSIVQAVQNEVARGSSFGISTQLELLLARAIIENIPSLDKLRFVSSGTEATMTAIRLARGFTKRPFIVKFNGNYHGHADHLLVQAGSGVSLLNGQASSEGVPEGFVQYTLSLPYNDCEAVRNVFRKNSQIAAVIVEPIAANMGVVPASEQFLQTLREETEKSGALLIFDEVVTGFRVGLEGAQGLYGITPDLTCLGKIIGGGFPAAAFGGRQEIMDCLAPLGQVYQAGTLSGNPVAMRAGLETIKQLEQPRFYEILEAKTRRLIDPILEKIEKQKLDVCINRQGSMFTLFCGVKKVSCREDLNQMNISQFNALFEYLFDKGIYIPPSPFEAWFISSTHTDAQLDSTRDAILEFFS
jgi:glutamate-1-semialdehyde 2,1-aminomutase